MVTYYFHVSKDSRIKYNFDQNLFSLIGDLIISDLKTARLLSEKINRIRREEGNTDQLITAGQLNALGLLHEIFHLLIRKYEENDNPGVIQRGLDFLKESFTEDELDKVLTKFVEDYPPLPVYKNEISVNDFLNGKTKNKSNKEIVLEEVILLHLENLNPSTHQLKEFYSDEVIAAQTKYKELIEKTESFLEKEKPVSIGGGLNLFAFLKKPIISNPYNIEEQLDFIRENWKDYLGEEILSRLLGGKDLIREDYKLFVQHGGGEKGTPPVPSYEFDVAYFESLKQKLAEGKTLSDSELQYYQLEVQRFTADVDWMPKVVMIAKNVFVWLYQLSKKYNKEIKTLDQIPDEELDRLARWNFTALWLIGLWERSTASQKIKQMMGNPEAASSAYSLYDYAVAKELGGDEAFENLKRRAWQRGIRLSSDMVPNHTGIHSKWVVENPHYFNQSKTPPFPAYKFTGPNLSDDNRVEVRIEDQYFSKTDAAVVFERLDRYTGDRTYIYHGNDGTNMPWNDTAQLNLMLAEVRESLIQTIMHVARKTPIIRFDAAMTLTKKHYQRLWFPIPGTGGAIPSRADYALTRSQFDEKMPEEFWREVVDRINNEMPETLLLAEAFWLMEGYFVRSLGMHRVYNSAFMHMFMKEENEKYKLLIKNTLAFNPEILKRYVNFMSNPDEETAINQFGKGDKYFGVATMMLTLPGLPMFAHGQIEGYSEKYGMEYKRSYYNEFVDDHLVWQHEKEIFPLMRKRHIFSQVTDFELYDFVSPAGDINENVFAFTNRNGSEAALVVYNNSYFEATGKINYSCQKAKDAEGHTSNRTIASALGINNSTGFFYIYKDFVKNEEFILNGKQIWENGFSVHLWGYQRRVFLDFKEVYDFDGKYHQINNHLQGRGVNSIDEAIKELHLMPFHNSLINFFASEKVDKLTEALDDKEKLETIKIDSDIEDLAKQISLLVKSETEEKKESTFNATLESISDFITITDSVSASKRKTQWQKELLEYFPTKESDNYRKDLSYLVINYFLKDYLFQQNGEKLFDELMLWKPLFEIFSYLGFGDNTGSMYELIKCIHTTKDFPSEKAELAVKSAKTKKTTKKTKVDENKELYKYLNEIFADDYCSSYLRINEYEGTKYFNKERFNELIKWFLIKSSFNKFIPEHNKSNKLTEANIKKLFVSAVKPNVEFCSNIAAVLKASEYKVDKFLNLLVGESVSEVELNKNKIEE